MTRRWTVLALLAGVAVIAIGAYAIGAGKSSKDLVLCAAKKGGDLSLATAKGKCAKGEKKLTVAKEGPVGPAGPQGAPGSAANVASEPVTYVTGPANDQCFEKPGTFCESESGYVTWGNYSPEFGNVGYYKDAAGVVHLTGVASSAVGGVVFGFQPEGPFYLPPGYRPSVVKMFSVPSQTAPEEEFSDHVTIRVRPNGVVAISTDDNVREVALEGVAFVP
ncbi:MAG TPA: hypothetical protein VFB52_01820 [Solirubrobacterales bacterium]|nr:hypothetical protein [Solirubrobacterales bacterium]